MQRGFVRYIQRQDSCADGPAGLMSGIWHSFLLLFDYFFAIALCSMWLSLCESPVHHLPHTMLRCLVVFAKAMALIWPFFLCEL
jgi:squalene monooxygenase